MKLEEYLKERNTIAQDLIKLIGKYFFEGTNMDMFTQAQTQLIEAGNNIVNWKRLLK